MNLVIENLKFDFELGCKVLKCSGGDCPINGLEDKWDSIVPITFKEIAETLIFPISPSTIKFL